MTDEIHSCSYYCDRPACIKAQRDELVRMYVEAKSEWPSKEDCRTLLAKLPLCAAHTPIEMIHAALQYVRTPVGLVSDDDVERACEVYANASDNPWPYTKEEWNENDRMYMRAALESYASRHAPIKAKP